MKENSREEDMKILEEFKTNGYSILLMKYGDRIKTNFKLGKAIEHILSDYKRVLKENEELNLKYYMLYTGKIENLKAQEVKIKSQVIPVQKVKDKIEEIDKKIKYEENEKVVIYLHKQKNILQKLLEGRK